MFDEKKIDPALVEVYDDIDALMNKILERLNNQTGIVGAMTKLRVTKMFINQVCTGGNKVHFMNEYNKIADKINKFQTDGKPLEVEEELNKKKAVNKAAGIVIKMPSRKERRKNKK